VLHVLGGVTGGDERHAVLEYRRAAALGRGLAGVLPSPPRSEPLARGVGPCRRVLRAVDVAADAGAVAERLLAHLPGRVLLRQDPAQGLDRRQTVAFVLGVVAAEVHHLLSRESRLAA